MTKLVIPSEKKDLRTFLSDLSKKARPHVQAGRFKSVNEALLHCYQAQAGTASLFSSKIWKEKGFRVRKDAVGFPIWARPRPAKRLVEDDNGKRKESFEFFPIARLFSEEQVEKSSS